MGANCKKPAFSVANTGSFGTLVQTSRPCGRWVVGWLGGWVVGWLGGWVVGWLGFFRGDELHQRCEPQSPPTQIAA
ncbi:hypothetical protein VB152_19485 [Xanthomonas fragariae]|nr:hypothetical protein [Xanthomonas fragariae]